MRKLIETEQNSLITCDNANCNFTIPFSREQENKFLVMYVDTACPDCGENLLTKEDYFQAEKIQNMVAWLNKWFSWMTLFQGKVRPEDEQSVLVHVHDGIKIKEGKLEELHSEPENLKTYTWRNLKAYVPK